MEENWRGRVGTSRWLGMEWPKCLHVCVVIYPLLHILPCLLVFPDLQEGASHLSPRWYVCLCVGVCVCVCVCVCLCACVVMKARQSKQNWSMASEKKIITAYVWANLQAQHALFDLMNTAAQHSWIWFLSAQRVRWHHVESLVFTRNCRGQQHSRRWTDTNSHSCKHTRTRAHTHTHTHNTTQKYS